MAIGFTRNEELAAGVDSEDAIKFLINISTLIH